MIALDRRDISQGPAANDIIDSPFNVDPPGTIGLGWENDVRSNTGDAGAFVTTDMAGTTVSISPWAGAMTTIMCARWMWACWLSNLPAGRGNAGRFTYSASLSYKTPFGPGALCHQRQILCDRNRPGRPGADQPVGGRDWLSNSFLNEAGVKFAALDDHLLGSLDWYVQNRTQLNRAPGITR